MLGKTAVNVLNVMLMQIAGMVLISVQFPGPRLPPRIKTLASVGGDASCWGQLWMLKHRHVDVVCFTAFSDMQPWLL